MSDVTRVPEGIASDAELITAVRQGDTAAFGALYERHAEAARRVAQRYVPATDADDVVAGAFEKVLGVLRAGKGPDVAFRAYLFTVVRRRAVEALEKARRTTATDDVDVFDSVVGPLASTEEPMLQGFEDRTVARAFESLPERWRTVLWYLDIEQQTPAAVAPALGMSANGVSALAYRAREGLRQAYLQAHLTTAGVADDCRAINEQLGSYARGGLARRETTRVEAHLDQCAVCRAAALELGDLAQGMRAVVAPLVLGTLGLGALGLLPLGGAVPAVGAAGAGAAAGTEGLAASQADAAAVLGRAAGAPVNGAGTAAGVVPGGAAAAPTAGVLAALAQVPVGVLLAAGFVVVGGLVAAVVAFSSGGSPVIPARPLSGGAETLQQPTSPPVATPVPVADDPEEEPTPESTESAAPPDGPLVPPASGDGPSSEPTGGTGPTADPSGEPGDEPSDEPTDDPSDEPAPEPTDEPTTEPTPSPTRSAAPTPTPSPSPTSTNEAEEPSDEPVAPTALRLAISQLRALGTASVTFSVSNTAPQTATDIEVELTLPQGVYVTGVGLSDSPVKAAPAAARTRLAFPTLFAFAPQTFSARVAAAISEAAAETTTWSCSTTETSVVCTVPDIAAGGEVSTTIDLMLDAYNMSELSVSARVTTAGGSTTMTLQVAVEPAPADVQARVLDDSALVAGGTGYLGVEVTNAGETSTPALVRVTLPEGADWSAERGGALSPGAEGWTCDLLDSPERTLECVTEDLPGNPRGLRDWVRLDLPAYTGTRELGKSELSWGPDADSLTTALYWPAPLLGVTIASEDVFLPRPAQYEPTDPGTLGFVVTGNGRSVSGARAVVELPELIELDAQPTMNDELCGVDGRTVVCALPVLSPGSQLRIEVPVRATVEQGGGTVWVPARVEIAHPAGPVVLGSGEGVIEVQSPVSLTSLTSLQVERALFHP
ncbi:RNA polymerase sigma factor (sigma-70 family) [Flavimobilis soli]|uniref:RNA polymerase sigma factor (Sigma-70 family) n=1 Tax=Flavimobilis soli TaxID=442709 RepID=A0A2A9ECY1_9MICO|nr:sigma-70 family RNA polymerase sigma factor [Flavimobilis soli]PFG36663.1 RNA polymerase sigma factor (sigma-70 family) [Flavimobilis soli]